MSQQQLNDILLLSLGCLSILCGLLTLPAAQLVILPSGALELMGFFGVGILYRTIVCLHQQPLPRIVTVEFDWSSQLMEV